ncbi:MAG: hypothetical protein K1Y36_29755 [Blastocatellia bacterium]|nr:hypothetical protein [Blastocatellia bacterium]
MNEDRPQRKTVFRHSLAGGVRSERLPQLLKQAPTPPPVAVPTPAPPKKHIPTSPPRIPATDKDLARAILLLGHRTKTELLKGAKDELTALIGGYPQPETAALWKATLKQIRKQNQVPLPEASNQE